MRAVSALVRACAGGSEALRHEPGCPSTIEESQAVSQAAYQAVSHSQAAAQAISESQAAHQAVSHSQAAAQAISESQAAHQAVSQAVYQAIHVQDS
jgi:hypothetical protein